MIGWIICPILLLLAIVGFAGDRIFYKIGVKETPKNPLEHSVVLRRKLRFMQASNTFEKVKFLSIVAIIACVLVFAFIDWGLCYTERSFSETIVVWKAELAVVPSAETLTSNSNCSFLCKGQEGNTYQIISAEADRVTFQELPEGSTEAPRIEEHRPCDMLEATKDYSKALFFRFWWKQSEVRTIVHETNSYPTYYVVYVPHGTISGNS